MVKIIIPISCSIPGIPPILHTEKKDRLTIIELLQNGSELKYCLNQEAIGIAGQLGVTKIYQTISRSENPSL